MHFSEEKVQDEAYFLAAVEGCVFTSVKAGRSRFF